MNQSCGRGVDETIDDYWVSKGIDLFRGIGFSLVEGILQYEGWGCYLLTVYRQLEQFYNLTEVPC